MRKKSIHYISGLALLAVLCVGCKPGYNPTVIDGFTQGTTFHIVIRDDIPANVNIRRDIDSIFLRAERSMSLYDPASLLCRLNRNETDSVDRYIAECIRIADRISRETDGLFDITVKPLTGAYGFAGEARNERPDIDSLLRFVGYGKIRVEDGRLIKAHPQVQIDLNAIAQGYTVDEVARHFDSLGLENYLIEMGGELFCRGANARNEKWTVGIDAPIDGNYIPGSDLQIRLRISGRGLATSGNYRKFYDTEAGERVVHTVNPRTGKPVISRVLSATVLAPDATLADVYGTYFMVAGLESAKDFLEKHPELDACIIFSDEQGDIRFLMTPNLEYEFPADLEAVGE